MPTWNPSNQNVWSHDNEGAIQAPHNLRLSDDTLHALQVPRAFLEAVWEDIDDVESPHFDNVATNCVHYLKPFTLENIMDTRSRISGRDELIREWRLGRLIWWLAVSGVCGLFFLSTNVTFLVFIVVPTAAGEIRVDIKQIARPEPSLKCSSFSCRSPRGSYVAPCFSTNWHIIFSGSSSFIASELRAVLS